MHVIQFIWDFPPEQIGGLGTHGYNLSLYLHSKIKLDVITPNQSLKLNNEYIHYLYIRKKKIFLNDDEINNHINQLNLAAVQKAEELIKKSNDTLILHSHDFFFAKALFFLKEKYNLPVITSMHLPQSPGSCVETFKNFEKLALKSSDIIICVSHFVANEIQQHYKIDPDKIKMIHNGLPKKEINKEVSRKFFLLFVGRLVLEKGLYVLIESMPYILENNPDIQLVIIGDGPLDFALRRKIKKSGLLDSVKMMGYVAESELERYYNEAFLLICPSLYEPFGLTVIEAMRSYLPVVASNVGGIKEIITHEESGLLVNVNDPIDLADKVISILENTNKWNYLAENGHKEFKNRFTIDKMGDKIIKNYEEFLG